MPRHLIVMYLSISTGISLILYSFIKIHNLEYIDTFTIPVNVIQSAQISRIIGIIFLLIARNIYQRKQFAWYLCMILEGVALIHYILIREPYHIMWFAILLFITLKSKGEFILKNSLYNVYYNIRLAIIYILSLWIYALFGFFLFHNSFSTSVSISAILQDYLYTVLGIGTDTLIPINYIGKGFETSITIFSYIIYAAAFLLITRPLWKNQQPYWKSLKKTVMSSVDSLSPFTLMPRKEYFGDNPYSSFSIVGSTAVSLPPVGNITQSFLRNINHYMEENGFQLIWYGVSEDSLPIFQKLHFKQDIIAEEATLSLAHLSLAGSHHKSLRNSYHKAIKNGLSVKLLRDDYIIDDKKSIQNLFLEWKKSHTYTFSMNFDPFSTQFEGDIWRIYHNSTLIGIITMLPFNNYQSYTLDLMIMSTKTPNGFTEAALCCIFFRYQEQSIETISLGMVPRLTSKQFIPNEIIKRFYTGESLKRFKDKFNPDWAPRFIVYPPNISLLQAYYAIARAHSPFKILDILSL